MKTFWKRQKHECPRGEDALRSGQQAAFELKDYLDGRLRNGGLLLDQYEDDTRTQAAVVVREIELLIRVFKERKCLEELAEEECRGR